ncbi:MAG: DJ-1/PfpI family protein [Duncaniella sp.]|nr:DJ-1/PfpI family protein [Duncaniella sp.]MDE6205145.1 DJ-1/PfpI family protein [Duncaniella sp.]
MVVYVFLADGFEEIEALTPIDLMRRADIHVVTVATGDSLEVKGAHGVIVHADVMLGSGCLPEADMLVCPGGMPGASNLAANKVLAAMLREQYDQGRYVAAICAAPAVTLAPLGILDGKKATCYPGFEQQLTQGGATHVAERVVEDGNIITANGPSSAMPFALALVSALRGQETAQSVAQGILL